MPFTSAKTTAKNSGDASPVKKASPTKTKLTRFEASKTPIKSPVPNLPQNSPIYVLSAKEGIALAYFTKPGKPSEQEFQGKIFTYFRIDADLKTRFQVTTIVTRRQVGGAYDEQMLASQTDGKTFPFLMFVKIHTDVNDNTTENNSAWGRNLAIACNEISNREFLYKKKFQFMADLSELDAAGELPAVNTYVINRDVIHLMDLSYPLSQYSRQEQAEHLTENYFGDDAAARCLIINTPDHV